MNQENVPFIVGLMGVVAFGVLFFSLPARSEGVEMELKVAQGQIERTHRIQDPQGTQIQCEMLGQLIVSKWIKENLPGNWIVLRITCGPPRVEF